MVVRISIVGSVVGKIREWMPQQAGGLSLWQTANLVLKMLRNPLTLLLGLPISILVLYLVYKAYKFVLTCLTLAIFIDAAVKSAFSARKAAGAAKLRRHVQSAGDKTILEGVEGFLSSSEDDVELHLCWWILATIVEVAFTLPLLSFFAMWKPLVLVASLLVVRPFVWPILVGPAPVMEQVASERQPKVTNGDTSAPAVVKSPNLSGNRPTPPKKRTTRKRTNSSVSID